MPNQDRSLVDAEYRSALRLYSECVRALRGLHGDELRKALRSAHEAHMAVVACREELAGFDQPVRKLPSAPIPQTARRQRVASK